MLAEGPHSLTAEFTPTGAALFTGSTSAPESYTVSAAVDDKSTPTVQFSDGGTALGGPVRVRSGVATTTAPSLPRGTRTLTVFTPTDPAAFRPSTSNPVGVRVL